ncbi:putative matrix protein [Wuhan Insect virus 4]|uniref:Putative matrix protein n=1 Tax=Wuhan Insect virus 4 TaxID=1608109 RepID=A0A0B5KTL5_9RHAB|nr:putative matrix protein [Wuhan Insect virus 4]AJG39177.1 putative matrix protein [Wuhan Insect virus 4]
MNHYLRFHPFEWSADCISCKGNEPPVITESMIKEFIQGSISMLIHDKVPKIADVMIGMMNADYIHPTVLKYRSRLIGSCGLKCAFKIREESLVSGLEMLELGDTRISGSKNVKYDNCIYQIKIDGVIKCVLIKEEDADLLCSAKPYLPIGMMETQKTADDKNKTKSKEVKKF